MKLPFAFAFLLAVGISMASPAAEPDTSWTSEKGITAGVLVKGSISPDGQYALYEFNHWDGGSPDGVTTATSIGLGPVDRSKLLVIIDSRTKWMTDQEVTSFLTVVWNRSSTLLATHDSGNKHSKAHLYRVQNGAASSLDTPDLLPLACTRLSIPQSAVTASGQNRIRWLDDHSLEISVRITTRSHKLTTTIPVHVADDGRVAVP